MMSPWTLQFDPGPDHTWIDSTLRLETLPELFAVVEEFSRMYYQGFDLNLFPLPHAKGGRMTRYRMINRLTGATIEYHPSGWVYT